MDLLCSAFRAATKEYRGPVYLDSEAIYMLPEMHAGAATVGASGAAVGGVIGAGGGHSHARKASLPFQRHFHDLSASVQNDPLWGRVDPDSPVVVVPKSAVRKISLSLWASCKVTTDFHKFLLVVPFFQIRRTRETFARYGWTQRS